MRLILFSVSLMLLIFISACGNKAAKDINYSDTASAENKHYSRPTQKTSVRANRSEVLAKVIDKSVTDTTDFSLTVKLLNVAEDPDNNSIATQGATYTLRPGFILGGNQLILNDPRNKKLLKLKDLKKGDTFKAYIYMNSENQWIIQDVPD